MKTFHKRLLYADNYLCHGIITRERVGGECLYLYVYIIKLCWQLRLSHVLFFNNLHYVSLLPILFINSQPTTLLSHPRLLCVLIIVILPFASNFPSYNFFFFFSCLCLGVAKGNLIWDETAVKKREKERVHKQSHKEWNKRKNFPCIAMWI